MTYAGTPPSTCGLFPSLVVFCVLTGRGALDSDVVLRVIDAVVIPLATPAQRTTS